VYRRLRRPPVARLSPGQIDAVAQTLRRLSNLDFGEREARDGVHATGAHVGCDGVESFALERLTRDSWEKAS
jgi:hypothetical protein